MDLNLRILVENVLKLMQANATKKGIEMYNHIHPDIYIHGDPNLTVTVNRNLVSNAIKYTINGGYFRMEGSGLENKIEIGIIDNYVEFLRIRSIFNLQLLEVSDNRNNRRIRNRTWTDRM